MEIEIDWDKVRENLKGATEQVPYYMVFVPIRQLMKAKASIPSDLKLYECDGMTDFAIRTGSGLVVDERAIAVMKA